MDTLFPIGFETIPCGFGLNVIENGESVQNILRAGMILYREDSLYPRVCTIFFFSGATIQYNP